MTEPLIGWLHPFLWVVGSAGNLRSNLDFIEGLEMEHRVRRRFAREHSQSAGLDLQHRIREGGSFGLDVANYALATLNTTYNMDLPEIVAGLHDLLQKSGSAWQVTSFGSERDLTFRLTRRDLAGAKEAISEIRSSGERAGGFLMDSWGAIATRDPRPSEGYDKAVKAIEAAAHPVVSPNHSTATLGSMLGEMRANTARWLFALGDIDLVIDMATRVWTTHFRHGTQQRDDHTLEEADAALHLAIPLVRFFVGGLVSRS